MLNIVVIIAFAIFFFMKPWSAIAFAINTALVTLFVWAILKTFGWLP